MLALTDDDLTGACPALAAERQTGPRAARPFCFSFQEGPGPPVILVPMPKQSRHNGTPGKKPPAPSVKVGLGRSNKPLAPSAQRRPAARRDIDEAEIGRHPKPARVRRGRG
jgi:hypothetical protein